MSNILKRKNEEDPDVPADDQLNKRLALDREPSPEQETDEKSASSPKLDEHSNLETESQNQEDNTTETASDTVHKNEETSAAVATAEPSAQTAAETETSGNDAITSPESRDRDGDSYDSYSHSKTNTGTSNPAKPYKDDMDHVSMRMYCPTKEAGVIVGKKGERIMHIREKANVRIHVSENLKNVPERVISVKGSPENVARGFGLITRTILDEPEDEPASMMSKQYVLKLLVPHPMVGFIIGKQGSKFREIEENSAAKLKAAEQPLPFSTDRVLSVSGVADAIHIAVYYISQLVLEHREVLKKQKVVFYNPMNFHHQPQHNPMMPHPSSNMPYMPNNPMQMPGMGGPIGGPIGGPMGGPGGPGPMGGAGPMGGQQKPYDFQMMFQPAVRPQYNGPSNLPTTTVPPQSSYTDEHGNTIVGDVITKMPVQISTAPDRFTQDVFVANNTIGSVIGKGGHNIKQIRESSGCTYVKIEPDQHQSILLGGGKGLTNIRKLTLTGSYTAIQTAIFFINQRIGADKERNGVQ